MSNLPISDESHDQERRSIRVFENVVDYNLFVIRNEDGIDYGVDRILEFTNLFGYG